MTAPPAALIADISLLVAGAGPLILLVLMWVALARIAAPVTGRIAVVSAWTSGLTRDIESDFRYSYILGLFRDLETCERRFDRGEVSWDDYHRTWSATFRQLSP